MAHAQHKPFCGGTEGTEESTTCRQCLPPTRPPAPFHPPFNLGTALVSNTHHTPLTHTHLTPTRADISWGFWRVTGVELAHPRPGGLHPAALYAFRAICITMNG